jgi:hypothetical protein
MPQIDSSKLSKEVSDKYSIVSNAFRLAKTENPKDIIVSEVGDVKQAEFYPQLKIGRWGNSAEDNEVNLSVRFKDTEYEKATITTDKDKIIWDKDNIKIEFFDYAEGEGGHKMIWYLKSKPLTNKVEFSLQSKGLDFFRQPPLTEEFKNGYSEQFQKEIVVSETQVKDLEGNVLVERPENVVGSYAVYHSTKGGMNDISGKEYKTGKAFHIYRPHIIDAEGKETWGILHIENGIYSVEIPQEFLDKAVYPIKSNDEFGYHTQGNSSTLAYDDETYGSVFTGAAGTATVIGAYTQGYSNTNSYAKGLVVLHSNLNIISNGITNGVNFGGAADWKTATFGTNPTISAVDYVLMLVVGLSVSQGLYIYYDAGTTNQGHYDWSNSYASPSNPTDATHEDNKYSIYATYTPAGGGGIPNKVLRVMQAVNRANTY